MTDVSASRAAPAPPALSAPPIVAGTLTVRFWAAAREAAGVPERLVTAESCAALVATLTAESPQLGRVLAISSLLIDGRRTPPTDAQRLPDGTVVEVLPPFAGG